MKFSLLSARRRAFVVAAAFGALALAGCGPKDGLRELEQGKKAYEVRDLARAERLFAESLMRAPDDVDRLLYLARVKLDLGELPAARELVSRAASGANGASDVALLAAQVAWHEKDYAAAAGGFSAVAADASLPSSVRAQAWAGLGIVEMTCENPHLARLAFLRAIRLDRRNAAAWYHLGLVYRDSFGYLEAAREQFEIYVRLEQEASPRVQKVQRTILPALKEKIAAAETERPGMSGRNSAASASALAKAEAELKKGGLKKARAAYQEALAADPLSYQAALGLAKVIEMADASDAGRRQAFESYKTACTLRPSAVSTFLKTGDLALKLGYPTQAAEIYSRAVAASPTSLDAIDGLIRAFRKAGNKAKVAQAYQQYRDSLKK